GARTRRRDPHHRMCTARGDHDLAADLRWRARRTHRAPGDVSPAHPDPSPSTSWFTVPTTFSPSESVQGVRMSTSSGVDEFRAMYRDALTAPESFGIIGRVASAGSLRTGRALRVVADIVLTGAIADRPHQRIGGGAHRARIAVAE